MRRPRPILLLAPALLALAACTDPPRGPEPKDSGNVEPDVFDVIRASNSKQAVERLRDRFHEETEHAKLLEARIDELRAAEEALAVEQRQRLDSLQKIKDELRAIVDQNGALEKQLAAELARRDDLKKKIDAAQQENVAPAPKAAGSNDAKPAEKKDGG
jgi:septal ring factor EnvC (AmiA/AmiB activator)